ncbi:MAG: TonB-dependent receptor, partial [Myxococcales bacterium]|nr:TonB-dependent receptor [Myxococcales bacterium]
NVQWSTVGLIKYEPNKDNKLAASVFYSRDADDEVRELEGTTENGTLLTTRLRYAMRSVLFTRLGGAHTIPKAKNLKIDWFGSFAQARRDDPSIRDMVYQRDQNDPSAPWQLSGSGATDTFLALKDNTESGAVNFTMPFKQWRQLEGKVKIGAWVEGKQREFDVRRFIFATAPGLSAPSGTGNILINKNIGGGESAANGGTAPFVLNETTQPIDSYRAHQEIYATYGMLELPFVRWFRIAGGARFEANRQFVGPYDAFTGETDEENTTKIRDNNVLPALSLIFPATDKMNVRISGTQTVARPEFREVAPFLFTDFVGGISVLGEPGLDSSKIYNGDVRWEWFPSAEEVIAVSAFGKYFENPIERTIKPGTSNILVSFQNAKLAYNLGVEFEARKNLEFMWKRLSAFSVGVNFAYVYSRVKLGDACNISDPDCTSEMAQDVSTSRTRPLQGQAPFVINAYVDYDNKKSGTGVRVLYNAVMRNIAFVGGLGLPDVYAEAIHQLDFVGRQRIYKGLAASLQVQNILNWPTRWRQGPERLHNFDVRRGANIMIGLSYDL